MQLLIQLLLAVLLMIGFVKSQTTCKIDASAPCVCNSSNGKSIDLRSLFSSETKALTTTDSGAKFYYSPCAPFTTGQCTNVAGCQESGGSTRSLGVLSSVTVDSSDSNIVFKYTGGTDSRQFDVKLICEHNSDVTFTYINEDPTKDYHLELRSKCCCFGGCSSSQSGGSSKWHNPGVVGITLMCVFVAAVVAYFVGGMILLRVKYEKTGTDVIPNKDFWKDFPFLLKDGFMFSISPCIWGYYRLSGRDGYSTM